MRLIEPMLRDGLRRVILMVNHFKLLLLIKEVQQEELHHLNKTGDLILPTKEVEIKDNSHLHPELLKEVTMVLMQVQLLKSYVQD